MTAIRILRRFGIGMVVLLLTLALVVTIGGVFAIRASFPQLSGQIAVPGLAGRVEVYRDAQGVPQIYADNAEDLFRAQGYVHAQDRFWEMDFRRHVTAGRLSELFGTSAIKTDTVIRTLGWRRVATQEYAELTPATQSYLKAYAAGVNAWLGGHSGATASLEHGLLRLTNRGYSIEKWDPVDSVAWLKAMAWDLRTNVTDEISRAQLLAGGLTRASIEELYPAYPSGHQPIVSGGAIVAGQFDPAAVREPAVGEPAATPTTAGGGGGDDGAAPPEPSALAAIPALLGTGDGIGSNSWVVSGAHTDTGKPLLANDPHLGPSLPSVWHQVGLHCTTVGPECPFDVTGFGFAGTPGVVIGHNARVAWGFTNLGADVADLYLEKVDGDSAEVDGRRVPLRVHTEKIKVAGGDEVTITVRSTGHGPLLSDADPALRRIGAKAAVDDTGAPAAQAHPHTPGYGVALRWTALDPAHAMDAVFAIDTAHDWPSFRAAAALFAVPSQNLVYADVDGNIGYQAPGAIPIRSSGDGRWPVPGWLSRYDWQGTVPFEQLPQMLNPADGVIVTANQQVIGPDYPHLLTADWDYGYRSQRIRADLAVAPAPLRAADMERIQADTYNPNAPALVPALLAVDVPARVRTARDLLRHWDYSQPAESAPAAYFNAVWRHLLLATFDELPADEKPSGGGRWFEVVKGLLAKPDSPWWDDQRTPDVETRDDILAVAMGAAERELTGRLGGNPSAWKWGDLHTLTLRSASFGSSGIAPLEWLFNRGPEPVAGGGSIVDATNWNAAEGYDVTGVPSMRMVIDLADLDRSRWIDLTGTSGHPFHPYYTDQAELWRTNRSRPMPFTRAANERAAVNHLTLTPRE